MGKNVFPDQIRQLGSSQPRDECSPLDCPLYMLISTKTTFVVTPLPMQPSAETEEFIKSQPNFNLKSSKSLVIDKTSLKIKECERKCSEDATIWVKEILGVLGILNIMGVEHLLVITGKGEVCRMPHRYQPSPSQCSVIYELQEVEIIPFSEPFSKGVTQMAEGLKRFLKCGFYFSYTIDLTANASRRERYAMDYPLNAS